MTDKQSRRTGVRSRLAWTAESLRQGTMKDIEGRWYATNTREPIRDETLRSGLIPLHAVVERTGLPTTSSKPRYALAREFASLLQTIASDPVAQAEEIADWRETHLSASARARVTLLRQAATETAAEERVRVTYPNGETRLLCPGPSTTITRAVIQDFLPRFLLKPAVILVSDSGERLYARDDKLVASLGLRLDPSRNLPDIIAVDAVNDPLLVFVEVVATDGAITEERRRALQRIAADAGFSANSTVFVTAFLDRGASVFRRLLKDLAWGTIAWFATEPDELLVLRRGALRELGGLAGVELPNEEERKS